MCSKYDPFLWGPLYLFAPMEISVQLPRRGLPFRRAAGSCASSPAPHNRVLLLVACCCLLFHVCKSMSGPFFPCIFAHNVCPLPPDVFLACALLQNQTWNGLLQLPLSLFISQTSWTPLSVFSLVHVFSPLEIFKLHKDRVPLFESPLCYLTPGYMWWLPSVFLTAGDIVRSKHCCRT